ncbi:ABC transporter substrate-binding protein [Paenibacillus sp. J22TS3]|uniref:ABC transporter substrate-binding protein n=1 Tax=Paenibacillus sp. J22TS3 TaxID=2807192 RepID=UPI001B1C5626|nr:extracellular solute-binding protein [Paenibacillus sp. J22TS3]GIP22868.1 ABC transporter substrate-binding protein [Paenibacillus sp. J22TS3]
MVKGLKVGAAVLIALSLLSGCGSNDSSGGSGDSAGSGKVELQFLQYKPEARDTFDKLIAKFEQANPNIHVIQDNPPDASTALMTKAASGQLPDVIANGGDNVHASLVQSGVLADLSSDPNLQKVSDVYVKILHDISGSDKTYGIPYGVNANGVIYNKALFKEMNLTIPQTWDEFIALCKKIQDAGKLPFYFSFKDAWTSQPAFNALAASTQGSDFYKRHSEGKTTYTSEYKEAADKLLQLVTFGQKDSFGKGYNDANVAFAKGESVMYAQGVWAIAEIKKANPSIELGIFPYPATNDPSKNKLISGVDQLLSISASTEHPNEAKKFVEFLLDPANAKEYVKGVNTFSAVKGVTQDDPSVSDLAPYFDKGQIADFVDHYTPSNMKLDQLLQELIMKKDVAGFLKNMDDEWSKAESRK